MTDFPVSESTKPQRRKEALAQRALLPMATLSGCIRERLAAWEIFQAANRVLFYHPFRHEVALTQLAETFAHKQWYLPVVDANRESMAFHRYHPACDLKTGEYGIQEPHGNVDQPPLPPETLSADDLMIVPGLVFDPYGFRLGYGKGYFDRYLGRLKALGIQCQTVGAVPEALLVNHLPRDAWDLPVNWLITEQRVFKAQPS